MNANRDSESGNGPVLPGAADPARPHRWLKPRDRRPRFGDGGKATRPAPVPRRSRAAFALPVVALAAVSEVNRDPPMRVVVVPVEHGS